MPESQAAVERWETRMRAKESGAAFLRLADLLLAADRSEEALKVLEDKVAGGNAYHGALLQLGRLLFQRGRDLEARSHLLRLLGDDPGNKLALIELAERAAAALRWDEASRYFQRLSELDPQNSHWEERLRNARTEAANRPGGGGLHSGAGYRPLPTLTLVEIYLAQGYRDKALAVLQEMSAADPDRLEVRDRIREIEQGLSAPLQGAPLATEGPDAEPGKPPLGAGALTSQLERVRREAAERRAEEKQMFQSWVNNQRRSRDQG